MKAAAYLKKEFKVPLQETKRIFQKKDATFQEAVHDLEFILHCVRNNVIKIEPRDNTITVKTNPVDEDINQNEDFKVPDDGQKKKKRGRPLKQSTVNSTRTRSNSSDDSPFDDGVSSTTTTSSKSQRAAAQAAGQKRAQMQNLMKTRKLRRPSDFDEKQAKLRKTLRSRSASISACTGEGEDGPVGSDQEDTNKQLVNGHKLQVCEVALERINTPTVKSLTNNISKRGGSVSSKDGENDLGGTENVVNGEEAVVNGHGLQTCVVSLDRMSTPKVKSLTNSRGKSKSLERTSRKRTSADIFNDSAPLSQFLSEAEDKQPDPPAKKKQRKGLAVKETPNVDADLTQSNAECRINNKKCKNITSDVETEPIAHSSPVACDSSASGEMFNGFDSKPDIVINSDKQHHDDDGDELENVESQISKNEIQKIPIVTDIKTTKSRNNKTFRKTETRLKTDDKENTDRNDVTVTLSDQIEKSSEENSNAKTRTRIIGKKEQAGVEEEEDKIDMDNQIETTESVRQQGDSPNMRSRTRVIKKAEQIETTESVRQQGDSPNMRSRTRVIKKAEQTTSQVTSDDNNIDLVIDESPEVNIRSRTKTLKKTTVASPEEEINTRCRTRTIIKAVQTGPMEENNEKYLASEFKNKSEEVSKQNKKIVPELPKSPAPPKGELVKKLVEDYEKRKIGDEAEEEKPNRVTRNTSRNKAPGTADYKVTRRKSRLTVRSVKTGIRKSINLRTAAKRNRREENKENVNVPYNKLLDSGSKLQGTPLSNIKVTPQVFHSSSKIQVVNKFAHATNYTTPSENKASMYKQSADDAEKRKKEEEYMKRQAKEEGAKKKKENTLKATAEETRRKREEKLQKVAAAREAAEREKALLAAKLEKEKEEKMRLIASEKEKQKEEQLKKKLLFQQKALEHEERRKQEEAARLAKIKEQEKEHKRIMAMKEREQELLQKQQKAADLRLAEAEKAKNQGTSKLGKLAVANNAKLKIQRDMTPSEKTNCVQSQSYDITPAREDRPQLKPKTEDDYGLDDAQSDDSSDEESCPKKQIPLWAQSKNRGNRITATTYIPSELWAQFMVTNVNPDMKKLFAGAVVKNRIRKSSAVWRTPPRCHHFQN